MARGFFAQVAVNRLVRPVWRALVSFGGLWLPYDPSGIADPAGALGTVGTAESRRDRLRAS